MLGLPWPEWGDTDTILLWAGAELRASRCPCGCGLPREVAHDPDNVGRFVIDTAECYARQALTEWQQRDKPESHVLAGVRLADEDDPEARPFDPERAAAIHAQLIRDLEV